MQRGRRRRWATGLHSPGRPPGDAELLRAVRSGDEDAFAELWHRHAAAARVAARNFTSIADPDDLVSEAYTRILTAIRRGHGPAEAFRPYLYATLRNVARALSHDEEPVLVEDIDLFTDPESSEPRLTAPEELTVAAFRSLPERWQAVLWYSEVEGLEPRELAPFLRMSPNSAAALAYRAREGLRQAWLQAHVEQDGVPEGCRWARERLARHERGGLSRKDAARVQAHLADCDECPAVVSRLRAVADRLPAVLAPLVLGGGAATVVAAGLRAEAATGSAAASAGATGAAGAIASAVTSPLGLLAAGAVLVAGGMGAYAAFTGAPDPTPPSVAEPVVHPTDDPSEPAGPPPTPVPSADPPAAPPGADTPADEEPTDRSRTDPPPAPQPPPDPDPSPPPAGPLPEPPVVTSEFDFGSLTRPSLAGTAEPGAVVTVHDHLGATLASVTAGPDGAWTTAPLDALPPAASTLSIVQVDTGGNVSSPTVLGPLAFVPVVEPAGPVIVCVPESVVPIDLQWWDGARIAVSLVDGPALDLFFSDSSGQEYYWSLTPGEPFLFPATDGWTDLEVGCTGEPITIVFGYESASGLTDLTIGPG